MEQPDLTTIAGICQAGVAHCARLTHEAGDAALGRVMGSRAYFTAVRAIDAPALAGDLDATMAGWRAVWAVVARCCTEE